MSQKNVEKTAAGDASTAGPVTNELPNKLEELDLNDTVVETKNLTFSYSSKSGNLLTNINMTIPRTSMYRIQKIESLS